MCRLLGSALLLLVFGLLSSGPEVLAQKSKAKPDPEKEGLKNTEKTIKAGLLVGRITNIYEESKKIRVQISVPVMRLDEGAAINLINARNEVVQAQLAMQLARDPNGIFQARQHLAQAQLRLAQAQATLYRPEMVTHDLEVQPTDEVIVRRTQPPQTFDDKGRLKKKYTKAELKELRGDDPKLPGYTAEFGDLQNDQIIRLTLVRKKGEKPAPAPKVKLPKKGQPPEEMDPAADLLGKLPQVSMIEILAEPLPNP
jgi:hypothetical protein